jgi:hypothetical protein
MRPRHGRDLRQCGRAGDTGQRKHSYKPLDHGWPHYITLATSWNRYRNPGRDGKAGAGRSVVHHRGGLMAPATAVADTARSVMLLLQYTGIGSKP